MELEIAESGWCACWERCRRVGEETVRARGYAEMCPACFAAQLRLPPGTTAGGVVAELLRREEGVAA